MSTRSVSRRHRGDAADAAVAGDDVDGDDDDGDDGDDDNGDRRRRHRRRGFCFCRRRGESDSDGKDGRIDWPSTAQTSSWMGR